MAFTASYIFDILDKYSAPLNRIRNGTKKFDNQVRRTRKSLARMQTRMKGVGTAMTGLGGIAGTAGAIALFAKIIDKSRDYEQALNNVEAVTGATAVQMGKLNKQARFLGLTTQYSALQSAKAMVELGRAGLKTNQIIDIMPNMLNLAAAGNLDLAKAADYATNVLQAFELPLSNIAHVGDVMAHAAANANTTVDQLAEALKNAAPLASAAGISVEQTSAMLMLLANSGVKGGEAGTLLMNTFRSMTNMTRKATKVFKKFGLDPKKLLDSTGKIKDFAGMLAILQKKGATLGDLFKMFDIRGTKAMAILKARGHESLSNFTQGLVNADGTMMKMAKTMMKGLPGALKILESAIEGAQLALGDTVKNGVTLMATKLAGLISGIAQGNPAFLKFIMVSLMLAAALGAIIIPLGFMAIAISGLMGLAAGLTAPLFMLMAAAAALSAGFFYWTTTSHPVIQSLKDMISYAWEATKSFWSLTGASSGSGRGFYELGMFFASAVEAIKSGLIVIEVPLVAIMSTISATIKLFTALWKVFSFDFKGAAADMASAWATLGKGGEKIYKSLKAEDDAFKKSIKYGAASIGIGGENYSAQLARTMHERQWFSDPMLEVSNLEKQKATESVTKQEVSMTGKIMVGATEGANVRSAEISTGDRGENLAGF